MADLKHLDRAFHSIKRLVATRQELHYIELARDLGLSIRWITLIGVSFLFVWGCALEPGTFYDTGRQLIHHEFLSHKRAKNKRIELFWTKPYGKGPFPAIIYIHGHQRERVGGRTYVGVGRLRRMAERGYIAAAVSQPGYGNSDGPPDFCGPFTQDAVLQAVAFLRGKPFVKADKVGLYGISRGAIVASMVATQDPKLAAVVLVAGTYDLEEAYPMSDIRGLLRNIDLETDGTPPTREAFRARSAIHHAEKIKSPLLILHGGDDYRLGPPDQAEVLGQKVRANGVPVQVKMFEGVGHRIPFSEQYREIYPFLKKYLL